MSDKVDPTTLDPRRKRARFRAWHRGTREMDLLLGSYADHVIATLSEDELTMLEALIDAPDQPLFAWVCGREPVPANYDTAVFRGLVSFHADRPHPG